MADALQPRFATHLFRVAAARGRLWSTIIPAFPHMPMLSAFAEFEREQISKRTRGALQAAKARGVKLGRHGATYLAPHNRDKANAFAAGLAPLISAIRAKGYLTTRAILNELNQRGIMPMGGAGRHWHLPTVHNLLRRIDSLPAA